jgi:(E)-4-hydroxy-3-methyl-but-2-enyl pyrophosphate reductase
VLRVLGGWARTSIGGLIGLKRNKYNQKLLVSISLTRSLAEVFYGIDPSNVLSFNGKVKPFYHMLINRLYAMSLPASTPLTSAETLLPLAHPKTVLLAEHSGFCHGVKRSVEQTLALGTTGASVLPVTPSATNTTPTDAQHPVKPVYVLGQLIHNQQVIDQLDNEGIITVQSLAEVPAGSRVVIRTHGAPPEVLETAAQAGLEVHDATCPDVRLVQNKAIQLAEEGYTVVIVGRKDHPEVVGIMAYCNRVPSAIIVAVDTPAEALTALANLPKRRVGVVSQTTQMEETFFETVKVVSKICKEMKVFNTICPATFYRQTAALQLAQQVQLMVVIGGKNSSNTTHMADICREYGTPTLHIETLADLVNTSCQAQLNAVQTVGVTAGASTPDWLVQPVVSYLQGQPTA